MRNNSANPAQYTCERPELISPWHAVARECGTKAARREAKEGQKQKRKIKNEKIKNYIRYNPAGAWLSWAILNSASSRSKSHRRLVERSLREYHGWARGLHL